MNWKHLLIGFVAGCVAATAVCQVMAKRKSGYVLHFLDVQTVDEDTRAPVAVGVKFPKHPDFTDSTAEPHKAVLLRVERGSESGITRVTWLGTESPNAYQFVLTADGYADLVVPSDLIETTSGLATVSVGRPATLLMVKAEEDGAGQAASAPQSKREGETEPEQESEERGQ